MRWLPLIWRNLWRNKIRSLLTGASIALSIALVCLLRTLPEGLDAVVNRLTENTRISIVNKAGVVYTLPSAYLRKVRALPGVVAATSWVWFGGAYQSDQGVTFPSFSVDPESIGVVYADYAIDPGQLAAFQAQRDAAIVGRSTLDRYSWKVGDQVTLESTVLPLTLSFHIVGEIPNPRVPLFWFRRDYLEQAMLAAGTPHDEVGMIWARVDAQERVGPVMRTIEEMFRNSEAEATCATEKSFIAEMFTEVGELVNLILGVTIIVVLSVVFIAANSASMAVRERVTELAVLRAIGFPRRVIFATLLAETTLLSTGAGIVGAFASLGLTLLVRSYVGSWAPHLGPLSEFLVTKATLVEAVCVGFLVGLAAGYLPSWGATKRPVAATLRELI